jgi:hypothetical protein
MTRSARDADRHKELFDTAIRIRVRETGRERPPTATIESLLSA